METNAASEPSSLTEEPSSSATLITAEEMAPGQLYQTAQSRARYFIELTRADLARKEIVCRAYYPNLPAWKEGLKLPFHYKIKELSEDDQRIAYELISKNGAEVQQAAEKVVGKVKVPGTGRSRGLRSGLGMLECWGKYFHQHAHAPNMRELIRAEMKTEFPDKHESVDRWLDAYRGYYNKGRLPNTPTPSLEISKEEWMKPNDIPTPTN